MAAFATGDIAIMPTQIAQGIIDKVQSGSAVAALSKQEPMRFGDVNIVTFENSPRAEFVGEGQQKSPTKGSFGLVKAIPHKTQVTMRFDQEVQWADEDYQLSILKKLADKGATALTRALDLGVFYRLDPLSGIPTDWTNYLNTTKKRVARTASPDVDIEKAIGLVLNDGEGLDVNGIALSRTTAFDIATLKDTQKRPLYPELGYGVNLTSFKGIPASVTTTVNAPEFTAPAEGDTSYTVPDVGAIVGDWQNGIYWGIQKNLPLETIVSGDPDGQGDLKRNNQIALRMEVLYAWYVFPERFAVVEGSAPSAKK